MPPFITCLCPTWCRPTLLQTAVACWADQDYPRDSTALLIGDDDDTPCDWSAETFRRALGASPQGGSHRNVDYARFSPGSSLPAKYNSMARLALTIWPQTEFFAVWEDDDLYLPHHLRGIAATRAGLPEGHDLWSHPQWVYSDYRLGQTNSNPDFIPREQTGGRFHAALAVSVAMWRDHPWIETEAANFDQQYLAALAAAKYPRVPWVKWFPASRQCQPTPSYIFRWHTQHLHGQSTMDSPDTTTWRRRVRSMMLHQHIESRRHDTFSVAYDERALWLIDLAAKEAQGGALDPVRAAARG